MANDYRKINKTPKKSGSSKQLLLVLVCFLLGYLTASVFDLTSLSSFVNTTILAQHFPSKVLKIEPKEAQLIKPKFEFYTLLASERDDANQESESLAKAQNIKSLVPVTIATAVNDNKIVKNKEDKNQVGSETQAVTKAISNNNSYLVQIAAFKNSQEAEKMKASLVAKGFVVNVSTVAQRKTNWYRVVIGPFPSISLAQKAQGDVARSEHIVGMIRKMEA